MCTDLKTKIMFTLPQGHVYVFIQGTKLDVVHSFAYHGSTWITGFSLVWFDFVLWHINDCRLFKPNPFLYI